MDTLSELEIIRMIVVLGIFFGVLILGMEID